MLAVNKIKILRKNTTKKESYYSLKRVNFTSLLLLPERIFKLNEFFSSLKFIGYDQLILFILRNFASLKETVNLNINPFEK